MKIDLEKLTRILRELYADVDSCECTSAVCILDTESKDGHPLQIQLLATSSIDEIITSGGEHYRCVKV